jgi:DNA-binding CsgD family transcriptional regulator
VAVGSPQQTRSDIVSLSHRGLGVREFSQAAARALGRRVRFDGACVLTLDPATLLPTGEVVENGLPAAATKHLTEIELSKPDFNKFTELARARRPAATLSHATERKLDRSMRHRELKRPNGFEDELRAALVDSSGTWGAITLLRETGSAYFTPADASLLASLSPYLAEGMRRAILLTALSANGDDPAVGLMLLGADNSVETANPAAQAWLEELDADESADQGLPVAVRAVAERARSVAAAGEPNGASSARARVRTPSGRWLLVRGSMIGDRSRARAAVIIEPARSHELAPLIARAYGLTERELLVTQLVAQGHQTSEIASKLHLSPYTVQDHLKAIFEKVGVSARGELVAQLFFEHYAPRLAGEAPVGPSGWFASPPLS